MGTNLDSVFAEVVRKMQDDEYGRDDIGLAWIVYTYLVQTLNEREGGSLHE